MPLMPASDPVKATLERKIAALEREMRALQRKFPEDRNPSPRVREISFSQPGSVVVNDVSGEYLLKACDGAIQRIDVTAKTAGSSDSELVLMINEVEKYRAVIPANERWYVEDGIYVEFDEFDTLSMTFDVVGTGLQGVVVTVSYGEQE